MASCFIAITVMVISAITAELIAGYAMRIYATAALLSAPNAESLSVIIAEACAKNATILIVKIV